MNTMEHDKSTPQSETLSGKEGLEATGREAAERARERFDDARAQAEAGLQDASAMAMDKAEAAKKDAAGEVRRTADGLEAAAAELEDSPLQRDLLHEAADGLKQISRSVEGKSLSEMASGLSDLARKNPAAFLGGAALAGFAMARFARATDPAEDDSAPRMAESRKTVDRPLPPSPRPAPMPSSAGPVPVDTPAPHRPTETTPAGRITNPTGV
ncbi:hypothetical protein [Amaricoccus macauensis]|uniref:hypothetical protein n=1 Tax=Amaricoccus macauensis TaxID=57001 RepID=UPI003C7A5CEC